MENLLAHEFAVMEAESAFRSATFFAVWAGYAAAPSIAAFVFTGGTPWLVSAATFAFFTVAFARAAVRRGDALAILEARRG